MPKGLVLSIWVLMELHKGSVISIIPLGSLIYIYSRESIEIIYIYFFLIKEVKEQEQLQINLIHHIFI